MEKSKVVSDKFLDKYQKSLEAHIKKIGLDPEKCRDTLEVGENRMKLCSYKFGFPFGGSFYSFAYDVIEHDRHRAYIFAEVGLFRFTELIDPELYLMLSKANFSIPHALKICLTEDRVLTLGFRLPADELTDEYLTELLFSFEHYGSAILEDIREFYNSHNAAVAKASKANSMI